MALYLHMDNRKIQDEIQLYNTIGNMYMYLFFSQASEWSGILTPWIWLANCARSSGPDFPIRTPRTDH